MKVAVLLVRDGFTTCIYLCKGQMGIDTCVKLAKEFSENCQCLIVRQGCYAIISGRTEREKLEVCTTEKVERRFL